MPLDVAIHHPVCLSVSGKLLLIINGTFSYSLEWPLKTGLTVLQFYRWTVSINNLKCKMV